MEFIRPESLGEGRAQRTHRTPGGGSNLNESVQPYKNPYFNLALFIMLNMNVAKR